jgi:hypothetical protein
MGRGGASKNRRLILLISVGWLPPDLSPSGACLALGTRLLNLLTLTRVTPHRGGASSDGYGHLTVKPFGTLDSTTRRPPYLGGARDLLGNRPHTRAQLTGHGHDDLMRMFAPCAELTIAFAQPGLGLPTEVWERLGELLQAALQVSAHVGWVAIRPGPFDQGPTGLGIPGLRDPSLASALATGICRRRQAQVIHELSRVLNAGQVPECGDAGDSHRQLHATEGWERFHDGIEPPGVDVFVECLGQPMEPFGVFGHRPHICLKDDLLRWGGTHDLAEPAQVRWAPGGPAGIPDIMS